MNDVVSEAVPYFPSFVCFDPDPDPDPNPLALAPVEFAVADGCCDPDPDPVMMPVVAPLTAADILNLSAYLASLPPTP